MGNPIEDKKKAKMASDKSAKYTKKDDAARRLQPNEKITRKFDLFGEDFEMVHYKNHTKVTTRLLPATWGYVILYAVFNALAIFAVKVVWFEHYGKPQLFFVAKEHGGNISLEEKAAASASPRPDNTSALMQRLEKL